MTFDEIVAELRRYYALLNEGREAEMADRISDDLRVMTRFGELRGVAARHHLEQIQQSQRDQFEVTIEPQEFFDAGNGTVVAFVCFKRVRRPPAEGYLTAWPAQVLRFGEDGKLVFFEGYTDREKALRDAGVRVEEPVREPERHHWWQRHHA